MNPKVLKCAISVAAGTLLLAPAGVLAAKLTCLTGTDPSVADDLPQITAVRTDVDAACPCASFDGSKGKTHAKYVSCANGVIGTQANAGNLRTQCKATVKKYYSVSTCGVAASKDDVPCIKTSAAGKVTCTIKPSTGCPGTPCATFSTCIAAADTNGDGIIGGGPGGTDTGMCACHAGFANCNGLTSGCETEISDDANNCGHCNHQCRAPSGTGTAAACVDSACSGQCSTGQTLCAPTADGGGACTQGTCPQLTAVFGNATTGIDTYDICPPDHAILLGFQAELSGGQLVQVSPICWDGVTKSYVTLNAQAGANATLTCPSPPSGQTAQIVPQGFFLPIAGYAFTGFQAFTDGTHITGLSILCAPYSATVTITCTGNGTQCFLTVDQLNMGQSVASGSVGLLSGTASPVINCPSGFGAAAANIVAGTGINAIGVGCLPPPVGQTIGPYPISFVCG